MGCRRRLTRARRRAHKGLKRVSPARRQELLDDTPRLVLLAGSSTPREFDQLVQRQIRHFDADDGEDRLARQRKATALKSWIDQHTGMWRLSGSFDPVTALALSGKLQNALTTLFNDRLPDGCPTDALAKQDFLRAHALIALVFGRAGEQGARLAADVSHGDPQHLGAAESAHPWPPFNSPASSTPGTSASGTSASGSTALGPTGILGRAEIIVVVDSTQADDNGGPRVDWGLPVEIPDRILTDLFAQSSTMIVTVVVRNGVILHAPGRLDLGRTTRIANRAQRRALRGLYPTCSIPGCRVPFEMTKLHHVFWWRHGGRTDLINLVPLCTEHHHRVHDNGWQLHLARDRTLTITFPDGRTIVTCRASKPAA